jgi:hypothetical protein
MGVDTDVRVGEGFCVDVAAELPPTGLQAARKSKRTKNMVTLDLRCMK